MKTIFLATFVLLSAGNSVLHAGHGTAAGNCDNRQHVARASRLWDDYCSERDNGPVERSINHRYVPAYGCGPRLGAGCGNSCGSAGGCGVSCGSGLAGRMGLTGGYDLSRGCGAHGCVTRGCGGCGAHGGLLGGLFQGLHPFGHAGLNLTGSGCGAGTCGGFSGTAAGCSSCGSANHVHSNHSYSYPSTNNYNHSNHGGHSGDYGHSTGAPTPAEPMPIQLDQSQLAPIDAAPAAEPQPTNPAPSAGDPNAPSTLQDPAIPTPDADGNSASLFRPLFKTARTW
jgi:hypothetical protein